MCNYHMHATFSDGKNTPEEVVQAAIEKGFTSVGISEHGYTGFDLRYCMQDEEGYFSEMSRLKSKYKDKIEIYTGVEEDIYSWVDRDKYDYIIGSVHYFYKGSQYYPLDSNYDYFKKCLEVYEYDVEMMAEDFFSSFCKYVKERRPDMLGHYDSITKFDELDTSLFLENPAYHKIAEKYTKVIADYGCMFEVNTGAMARGFRNNPYPNENLLYILKQKEARLVLASDAHSIELIDFGFAETRKYLRDIGFRYAYMRLHNQWEKYEL